MRGRVDEDNCRRESLQRGKVKGKWESVCDFSLISRLLHDEHKIFIVQ